MDRISGRFDQNQAPFHSMVPGMSTTRITVTLPDEQIHSIRELVAAGKAGSVSGFVKHAVSVGLFDAAGWRAMLDDALQQTGGSLTNEERKWADALLHPPD
jgi:Arc/MetJ-type ribon-helix-helix transcriptional regulator